MKALRANLAAIALCLAELLIGIVLLIDPDRFTRAALFLVGLVLLIAGAVCVVRYLVSKPERAAGEKNLAIGLACLLIGGIFIFRDGIFPSLTHIYGIALLIVGAVKSQQGIDRLRLHVPFWYVPLLNGILALVASVLILIDPFRTAEMLWRIVAIVLIAEAVLDLVTIITGFRTAPAPSGPPLGKTPARSASEKSAGADDTGFLPLDDGDAAQGPSGRDGAD